MHQNDRSTKITTKQQPSCDELIWLIIWTKAFPTLVPNLLFHTDHDPVWAKLAWNVIFTKDSFERKSDGRNSDPASQSTSTEWENSLGYGEVTEDAVFEIMTVLRNRSDNDLPPNPVIVDLGSGNGRILLAAALCFSIQQGIGIEIVPSLFNESIRKVNVWNRHDHIIALSSENNDKFLFSCNDFTKNKEWVSQANIVFIHATVFEDDLMMELNILCEQCRTGTYFCMVTKPLASNNITTLCELQVAMSWGQGNVYLQERI